MPVCLSLQFVDRQIVTKALFALPGDAFACNVRRNCEFIRVLSHVRVMLRWCLRHSMQGARQ